MLHHSQGMPYLSLGTIIRTCTLTTIGVEMSTKAMITSISTLKIIIKVKMVVQGQGLSIKTTKSLRENTKKNENRSKQHNIHLLPLIITIHQLKRQGSYPQEIMGPRLPIKLRLNKELERLPGLQSSQKSRLY